MLYLDILSHDGGQMYLDIQSVEAHGQGLAGVSMQGVLGDGCHEVEILVEFVHGDVSLTFIGREVPFAVANGAGDDFSDVLRRELRKELHHVGAHDLNFNQSGGVDIAF